MKLISKVLCLAFVLLLPALSFAAGTVTTSTQTQGKIKAITFAWTTDAAGDVDIDATGNGVFLRGGTAYAFAAVPVTGVTDAYDVKVRFEQGILGPGTVRELVFADILAGDGQNLSNSTDGAFAIFGAPFPVFSGRAYLIVENAGNAQSGTFVLYVWEE